MRINVLQDTPDQLRVRMTPTRAGFILVFSALMIVGGLLIVWALGDCSRISLRDGQVHYRTAVFDRFLVREDTLPVTDVEFDTDVYKDTVSTTRDVTLRIRSGDDVRIPFPMLGGEQKQQVVDSLAAAAASGQDHVESSDGSSLYLGGFLGLLTSGAGVFCLFFLQSSQLECSRPDDKISVTISRWLLPGTRSNSVKLREFRELTEEAVSAGTHNTPTASSNYVFVTTGSGETLSLSSGPMFTDSSSQLIREILQSWIEGEPANPDNVESPSA